MWRSAGNAWSAEVSANAFRIRVGCQTLEKNSGGTNDRNCNLKERNQDEMTNRTIVVRSVNLRAQLGRSCISDPDRDAY